MSIADVLASSGNFLIPDDDRCSTCLVQAYMHSIFGLSSVLWTSCITHSLNRAIRHTQQEHNDSTYQVRYHLFAWGVPILLAFLPQFWHAYGLENGRCWIMSTYPILRFVQFYIPLWLVVTYNVVRIALLFRHLFSLSHPSPSAEMGERRISVVDLRLMPTAPRELGHALLFVEVQGEVSSYWRLALYPAVLVLCWTPGTINRLHNSYQPDEPNFGLHMAQAILGDSQGLLNSVVYGSSPGVRAHLAIALAALMSKIRAGFCGCAARKRPAETEGEPRRTASIELQFIPLLCREVPAESCSNEVVLVDKLQRDEGEGVGCGNIVPEDGDGGNSVNDGDIGDVHDALGSKSASVDAHLLIAPTV